MSISTEQSGLTRARENDEEWLEHESRNLRDQFQRSQNLADLEESIRLAELLVNMTKEHDPCWPKRMHNLGCAHFNRYQATRPKSEEKLNDTIRLLQRVSVNQDIKYLEKPKLLADLQLCFHHRYRMKDQLDDLERSMEFGERARKLIPAGDKLLPKILSNLGNAYHDLYDDFACAPIDLDHAIDYARLAVSATTPLDPQLSHRQEILGTGLYTRRRSKEDIREAISLYMAALDDASVTGSKRGRRLDNLGAALFILFQADGHIDDLTGAIRYYELAVATDLETSEEYAERVGNLGAAYFEQHKRTGQESDLEEAMKYAKLATQSIYKDRKQEPKMVDSLAQMYHRRFLNQRVNPNTADLYEAIRLWKRAIELVPPKRPEKAQFYSNLGTGMETLYEESTDIQHLEKALEHWAKGVSLTSQDNPDRANRGTNLGHGYNRMFCHTNDVSFQKKALDLYLQSLRGLTGTPFDRMLAGQKAADVAQSRENWSDCADYLAECIELLPKITMPSNSQEDLEHLLRRLAGLGSRAAAVYLRAGRSPMESMQALDRCRTVIAGLLVNSKSDVSLLEERHPELAAEYKRLRDSISQRAFSFDPTEADGGIGLPKVDHAKQTERRLQDIRSIDEILDEIRQQPGFKRFQLALGASEILGLASSGPLIYFNVTSLGSYVFLINDGRVKSLELSLLNMKDLENALSFKFKGSGARRDVKLASRPENKSAKKSSFKSLGGLLAWLWDFAVKQVLRELGIKIQDNPPESLTHIWWVGGGPMALLPLHAAGSYSEGSTENAMSHVVSSYATSLKTLHYSRTKIWRPFATNSSKILVVAMPTTPEMDDLDVADEVSAVRSLHNPPRVAVEFLEYPRAIEVVQNITECSVVHFACHASSDNYKPSMSALYLGNGEEVDTLSVRTLQPLDNQLAQVAYLSACSTAEIGARNLVDESIHLASTFQLIGFRHVIGTLWPADDESAVKIATAFYMRLIESTEEEHVVSNAMHYALLIWRSELDKRGMSEEQQLRLWAPFIHLGP